MAASPTSRPPSARPPRSKTFLRLVLLLVLAAALAAFVNFLRLRAAQRAAHALANPVPATPAVLAAARSDYRTHCASCHGLAGDGKGDKAQGLFSKPSDFRIAARMARRTDGDLFYVTTKGNWPMPAFENKLSALERWQLVDYIRTFSAPAAAP